MQLQEKEISLKDVTPEWPAAKAEKAKRLCAAFLETPASKRFVFGRNTYADAVLKILPMAGIVDDFTDDTESNGTPILRMDDLPSDAFVLAVSGGRPLTVRSLLNAKGIRQIDYFSFMRWSGLSLPEAVFNEGFAELAQENRHQIEWVFGLLADEVSRATFLKLLSFRSSYDLDKLIGFTERQTEQYFEDFLDLHPEAPVFLDVGGFDGFTSKEFIRRFPKTRAVYIFEPEPVNFDRCSTDLADHKNVRVLPYGASEKNETLRFSANGSASRFCDDGEISLEVRRIDDLMEDAPTYIKMDIEGAELGAIRGAEQTIATHKPALALCVYHRPSDFWDIPRAVLSIEPGYKLYLRHYTESIYETVMYFVPGGTE